jgi:16S rRNA (guanine1207-N2)-methyltransferase
MNEHYFVRHPESKLSLGVVHAYFRSRLFEFLTASGVFSRTRIDLGTRLLVESMVLPENGLVLDLGCGYGPVGIAAAAFNPNLQVVMTDVNERAVWLARENAKRNGVENVKVRQGFLYEPVEDMKFEVVLSNPPITAGMKTVMPLIEQAPQHLAKEGTLQIVVRSKVSGKRLTNLMAETFGNVKVLARKSGYRVLISKAIKQSGRSNSRR